MQADVRIAGAGMTPFSGDADADVRTLLERAATRALDDAGVDGSAVDAVHVGNMAAEAFEEVSGLHNALAASVGAHGAQADRVENTSASGASAFQRGVQAVASGAADTALVVGGEKMSSASTETATGVIGSIVHAEEYAHGVTLPSFGGLAADAYLRRHDAPREALAEVAVKNHANGARNDYAQFQKRISVADALDSPLVADPLRLYDCCPTTDGAAALVLTNGGGAVSVRACESAVGTHAVAERADPLDIASVREAGERAFEAAERGRDDVDVACIHDAFTVLELLELEELGFYDAGEAWEATMDGETALDGALPVNPGGGLKARGHPLGGTGVSQLVELVWQLRGDADGRQVDCETGLAVNVAGFGNNAVCSLLEVAE
ncbi:thiolase family protein [Halobacterium litoreum]|uniref:Thiolase family protein n=1 Tax=Halobacterium litoreum TaxID=2039234 RepID=A0ABD5NCB2_9EURY|nr:thiolase family protein [Halobacterium litoreum]UHH14334.1 thiolase family protein [Halobacterium litoreum]